MDNTFVNLPRIEHYQSDAISNLLEFLFLDGVIDFQGNQHGMADEYEGRYKLAFRLSRMELVDFRHYFLKLPVNIQITL